MATVTPANPAIVLQTSKRPTPPRPCGAWHVRRGGATTFLVTVLIIGTLAFDAWDFVRQITLAERGMGWKMALTVIAGVLAATFVAPIVARTCAVTAPWSSGPSDSSAPVAFLVVVIIGFSVIGGWTVLNRLGTELTHVGWFPRRGLFDMSTIVVGTFLIVADRDARRGAARPRRGRLPRRVRPAAGAQGRQADLEMLAGIPSVVLGYFAIAFINPSSWCSCSAAPTRRSRCWPPASPSAS